MSAVTCKKFFLLLLCLGITIPAINAQQFRTVSAQNALQFLESRFGPEPVQWIAELRATGGQPQPLQWDILSYDMQSPGLLHHFRASSGVVQDGGTDSRRYPNDAPSGYFTPADIGVDSVAAFTIAEAEARKARLGFDSCDYFLKQREFTTETVWRLELVDATHRLVGAVFISGTNGQVLRTIWVQRESISGFPIISDSFSPSTRSFTGITGADNPGLQPLPGETGIAGFSPPTFPQPAPTAPYTPVSPEGIIRPIPDQNPATPARTGSIFREFPSEGGGSSSGTAVMIPSNNALNPTPQSMNIPAPEPLIDPLDPVISGNAPPINVPSSGGSTARIPPPPVPR